ncbi:hypothetical protein ABK040_007971 [Willaertia magna]
MQKSKQKLFASVTSDGLFDDYKHLQRQKKSVRTGQNSKSEYDSGLFQIKVSKDSIQLTEANEEKIIFKDYLEPCRYKLHLHKSGSSHSPIVVRVECQEINFDFETTFENEKDLIQEFDLFRKDGDNERKHPIFVTMKLIKQSSGKQNIQIKLFRKKDVVVAKVLKIKHKKQLIIQAQPGIYEVVVRNTAMDNDNKLSLQMSINVTEEEQNQISSFGGLNPALENHNDNNTKAKVKNLHSEQTVVDNLKTDWFSNRFTIYGKQQESNSPASITRVEIIMLLLSQLELPPEFGIYVYRIADETPVMEIAKFELSQLCQHLVARILYAFNVTKNIKELDQIILLCNNYEVLNEGQNETDDNNSIPEPLRKIAELAKSRKSLLIEQYRKKSEIEKGVAEKNVSILKRVMEDQRLSVEEMSPIAKEAQVLILEMEEKTKFENEIVKQLQQEADRFIKQHPNYDISEIFETQPIRYPFYKQITQDEMYNSGKKCGAMSHLFKHFYESVKIVNDEIENGHLVTTQNELMTKKVIFRKMAKTFSSEEDNQLWNVLFDDEDEEDFLEYNSPSSLINKGNTTPLLSAAASTSAKGNSKQQNNPQELSLGFIALMGLSNYTIDDYVKPKSGEEKDETSHLEMNQTKLTLEQFQSLYKTIRFVIVKGFKHVKKNVILQEKLSQAVAHKQLNSIEYYVNSLADKYLSKEEIARYRKIMYSLNDRNEGKFEALLNPLELQLWKEKQGERETRAPSVFDNIESPRKKLTTPTATSSSISNANNMTSVSSMIGTTAGNVNPVVQYNEEDSDSEISLSSSSSEEEEDEKSINVDTSPSVHTANEDVEEEDEGEDTVNYYIEGLDKVDCPNLTNQSEFVSIFGKQVEFFVNYLNTQKDKTKQSLEEVGDEAKKGNWTSAIFRKCVLPSFRALFIGPEEDPGDLFIDPENYNFDYIVNIAKSFTNNPVQQTPIIQELIKLVLTVHKDITIQDLWLKDKDHFKSSRFNAFWCHCLNRGIALQMYDEICKTTYIRKFYKITPKFVDKNVRVYLAKLSQLPLSLNCGFWLSQYDPYILVSEEE